MWPLKHLVRKLHASAPAREAAVAGFEARVRVADELRDRGDAAAAAVAYQSALDLVPERTDIRVQLGNMLKDANRLGAAEAAYRQALAENPGDADTHVQIGHLFKRMGRRAAALAAYRHALQLDPNAAAAVHELTQAGDMAAQARNFDVQLRAGGAEALLTISHQLASMREQLDGMIAHLPDASASVAFPIGLYDRFRDLFVVPPPSPFPSIPQRVAVLLLADDETLATLHDQIAGLQAQSWPDWTLTVIGVDPVRQALVAAAGDRDARIVWRAVLADETPAGSERSAADAMDADWLLLLAPAAVLDRQALAWIVAAGAAGPASAFVMDEEQVVVRQGRLVRTAPVLRQVVDYDTLLEANVFGETLAVRADAWRRLPPETVRTVTAGRSALLLAFCRHGGVGHIPFPLVRRDPAPPPDAAEHRAAVLAHLAGTGLAGRVGFDAAQGPTAIWHPQHPDSRITVIIPTRDNGADLACFVASLRTTAARPAALNILLVDNGSRDTLTRRVLADMTLTGQARVLAIDAPFNWSRLNNLAVAQTDAPLILFANDDMRMITQGWDARLRGLLERPEIGAVGAKLVYSDNTIQHAGVLFGWQGSTIHDGLYEPKDAPGPASRWQVSRAASAVTGAFLATRRADFLAQGGFDEVALPVSYSDIDYALKLRRAGFRVLWTPGIAAYHDESKTRGLDYADPAKAARNAAERSAMALRWGAVLESDPSVHPFWQDATLPFRLIAAASAARVGSHVVRCAMPQTWSLEPKHHALLTGALSMATSVSGQIRALNTTVPKI